MKTKINGLPLPQLLQDLMKQGRWKLPQDTTILKQMTDALFAEGFVFLDIGGMQLENENYPIHLGQDSELANIYHLTSSSIANNLIDDEILNIDKSVLIVVNWSEEAIALDYRFSDSNPIVKTSVCKDGYFTKWKTITPDFNSFASLLKL
jgi:hypothetical protein